MGLRNMRGRWQYRFRVQGQDVCALTGLEATARNKKKAEMMEAAHRQSIIEGRCGFRPLTARAFEDALPEFASWCKVEYAEHLASARRIHTSMASAGVFFGKQMISMITPGDVERYKIWRLTGDAKTGSVKPVTVKHDLDNLSVFFQWAVKSNYARQNSTKEVSRPSDAAAIRQRILTPAEERLYFAHATGALHDVARLILLQGMRPEEVLGLRSGDVDLESSLLHIRSGKTKSARRTLKLTQESASILAARLSDSEWVFRSPRKCGGHLTKLNGPHDRLCERLGLSFVLYDLRHTFATRLAESGADAFAIAAILGHSSTRVLSRYIHPTQRHQDAVMAAYDAENEKTRVRVVN